MCVCSWNWPWVPTGQHGWELEVPLICHPGMHGDIVKVEMTGLAGWSDEECEGGAQRSPRGFHRMRMVRLGEIRNSRERRTALHIYSHFWAGMERKYLFFFLHKHSELSLETSPSGRQESSLEVQACQRRGISVSFGWFDLLNKCSVSITHPLAGFSPRGI